MWTTDTLRWTTGCIGIGMLTRLGVLGSMEEFENEGEKALKQYYTHHIGKDLIEKILGSQSFIRMTGTL